MGECDQDRQKLPVCGEGKRDSFKLWRESPRHKRPGERPHAHPANNTNFRDAHRGRPFAVLLRGNGSGSGPLGADDEITGEFSGSLSA